MSKKVLVFISGRGSNLISLFNNQKDYQICGVITNNKEAKGIDFAKENNLPTYIFDRKDYSSLKEAKEKILKKTIEINPDLIALAGFMQIIDPKFIDKFYGKLINIHPSLLPKYPGLHTHEKAIKNKDEFHGCTVHFVDAGIDTGMRIANATCKIDQSDTSDSLAEKLLTKEHIIYPWVINNLSNGNIKLADNKLIFSDSLISEAKELYFNLNL